MPGARPPAAPDRPSLRLDKWLFQAQFFRARSLAAGLLAAGHCRLNGAQVTKPAHPVTPGDVLTFPQGDRIRVVRVRALGHRRGPAAEAAALYEDLAPASPGQLD